MDRSALSDLVAQTLDDEVTSVAGVSGGDVAESYRMQLSSGRAVFAKTHQTQPPEFFPTEATGLTWLREALLGGNAEVAVAVPEVLAVGDGYLVLEWIDERSGGVDERLERDLGRALAAIHRAVAPSFGRADRMTTGSRRLPNEPVGSWVEHIAANRLIPLARLWADLPSLPPEIGERLLALAGRLDQLGVPDEPPALLHGDLWAGNRITGRRVGERGTLNWLIDPAAHGGHREFDLAMMRLFGGFGPECFEAYDDDYPVAAGWEARVPLHQLVPVAVHAIKFGGGYVAATDRALDHIATL